jgi:predicted glycosyltransferase
MKIKVENESLVRDTNTNAILETDISKLNKHRAIKNAIAEREDKIDYLVEKINNLETIINRITNGNNNT